MTEKWMTVRQAADMLQVSIMWIHRRIAAGLIEASNEALAGRRPRYRIAESALDRYFLAQRAQVRRATPPLRRGRARDS